ncbi:MAG: hypothetical protein OXK80_01615 [Bdellovibrionales bacterium]|nr:hypothetical protein [Bdellovibrionales bacterium]
MVWKRVQSQVQSRIFLMRSNLLKTWMFYTHRDVTTPPHLNSWWWSRLGVVSV